MTFRWHVQAKLVAELESGTDSTHEEVAMILGMDEWTNSDTETEMENEPTKQWLYKLSHDRSKSGGCVVLRSLTYIL